MKYRYKVHSVSGKEYAAATIGSAFQGGQVVDGTAGRGDDLLVVTSHEIDDRYTPTSTGATAVVRASYE